MNKIKKILGILFILIIILVIAITILTKNDEGDSELDGIGLGKGYIDYTVYQVKTSSVYYTVEACIQKYLRYSSLDLNKEYPIIDDKGNKYYSAIPEGIENKDDQKKSIYNILSDDYKKNNNINLKNIDNYVDITNKPLKFTAIEMNYVEFKDTRIYSVYGRIEEKISGKFVDYSYFKVTFDINNKTFSVEPIQNCKNINSINLGKEESHIEKNNYNTFEYIKVAESNLINYYMNYLKTAMIKYPKEIYEKLDEEYKNAKFKTEEEFENYIEDREEIISEIVLDKYERKKYNDYTQYTCIDNYGNYYIFNQTAIMQFDILLDIYTIDLPEFIEKYETSTTEEKVALNIQKIVEALNVKDYNYVYGKLADEFKENYFKTYGDFEEYASKTFDIENEITYNKYTETKDLSTYKITLTGKNKTITKTIVMRLDEGTNFVMSFNVN